MTSRCNENHRFCIDYLQQFMSTFHEAAMQNIQVFFFASLCVTMVAWLREFDVIVCVAHIKFFLPVHFIYT